jgi:hypothetical protein
VQHKLLMMTGRLLLLILPIVLACKPMTKKREIHEADVIVYGGTSAAIVAAVQIVRMQKSVIVVSLMPTSEDSRQVDWAGQIRAKRK